MAEPRPGTVWGDTTTPEGENRRLFIGQISKNCTLADLREKFEKHGKIEGMAIKNGYAFLQYSRPKEALSAVTEDKTKLCGSIIGVRAYRSEKPPLKKAKPAQRERSRSPPSNRNIVNYDEWSSQMQNEPFPADRNPCPIGQVENAIGNEVEVIIWEPSPDMNQLKYAQRIEYRVRQETNIRTVDTYVLSNTEQLPELLNDLYKKKTLYAIVVGPLDPVNLTATLYLIRNTSAPKYRSLDEVMQIISHDYQSTYHGQPPSFRIEQFSRTDSGYFTPQLPQATQTSNQFYTRLPAPNIQARLGGYKVEESKPLYDSSSIDVKYSRSDNVFGFSLSQDANQEMKTETRHNLVMDPPKPFAFSARQQADSVLIKEEKMPKDVELSLRLILEQGHCRSMSEIQLESIIEYLQNQKLTLKQQMDNARIKVETKQDSKIDAKGANNAPLTNAFNILSQAGIMPNFADSNRHSVQQQIHVKEEQSDEPLIVQEKIASKPNQNANNQAVNSSSIGSVINSAFDVLQKSGINVRANMRSSNVNSNNTNQSVDSFHNPSFQSTSRRHPLNGTQIYPDHHQGTSFSSGRF